MTITVIGNLKGGTGKSTVTFNLSLWVAINRDTDVSVYDIDPQGTLTDVMEIRLEDDHEPVIKPHTDLTTLSKESKQTEVMIDIGMSDPETVNAALKHADRVIVPIAPSQADVWSTQEFIKIIKKARGRKKAIPVLGFMNRSDTHHSVRETDEAYEALQMLSGIEMLETRLYQRTVYRRSFSEGLAVFELQPRSKAAAEVALLGEELY